MAVINLNSNDYDGVTRLVGYNSVVQSAGDFDGDGFDDLVVGSLIRSGYYPYSYFRGTVSILEGGGAGLTERHLGSNDHSYLGKDVAGIGDLDGDGFSDVIISAPEAQSTTIVYGGPSGTPETRVHLAGPGSEARDAVASAGDFNNDGFADFMISGKNPANWDERAVYVTFGTADRFDDSNPPEAAFRLIGQGRHPAGYNMESAGDFNGDGFGDLLVSSPTNRIGGGVDAGVAYLIYGKASGFSDIELAALDPADGFRLTGDAGDKLGSFIGRIGDINGDGFDDIAVAQPDRTFVVFGNAEGVPPADLDAMSAEQGFELSGAPIHSIASAGDVDGDGIDDMIVGGPGIGCVIFGKRDGLSDMNVDALTSDQGFLIQSVGRLAVTSGDINGDGFGDIIARSSGAVHVIYGGLRFGRLDFTGTSDGDRHAAGIRDDELTGAGGNDILSGRGGHDTLLGGNGDDRLGGGNEDDLVDGGEGSDTASYLSALAGVTIDLTLTEQDTVGAGVDTLLSIENVDGSDHADTILGDLAVNRLEGGGGDDRLAGRGGGDRLIGGAGNDTADYSWAGNGVRVSLLVSAAQDTGAGRDVLSSIEHLIGSGHADTLIGNAGANILRGGGGDDLLVSDGGADILDGGEGHDEARFDRAGAGVVGMIGEQGNLIGIEAVVGSAFDDCFTGDGAANVLDGGAGDDDLDGGGGDDRLFGRGGDDVYRAGEGTRIFEAADSGTDLVIGSAVETILGRNVENLVLARGAVRGIGNGEANSINGNGGDNLLAGLDGDDVLAGRGGLDTLRGGAGDDLYVDTGSTLIVEGRDGGTDTMRSRGSHTLADNVERLILQTGVNATGNAIDNVILANNAANRIDGGAGADELRGLGGNDEYRVDDVGDRVAEAFDGGNDVVRSTVSRTLEENVETLVLEGSAFGGVGNALDNRLIGSDRGNRLDGGSGDDRMIGGLGDDIYVVGSTGDVVVESAGQGTDRVISAIAYTLGNHFEELVLGDGAIDGNGNALSNRIIGGGGDNSLSGLNGNDVLEGEAGDDRLLGGIGSDMLSGGADYDSLSGEAGADTLFGGSGNDGLVGGTENDGLSGGEGRDRLTGGSGADRFLFDAALDAVQNVDLISDFLAPDDTIMLERSIFGEAGPDGRLAAGAFHNGGAAADAGDRIIYNQANGSIYYDADGAGGAAGLLFARVAAGTVLTASDFVLYSAPPEIG